MVNLTGNPIMHTLAHRKNNAHGNDGYDGNGYSDGNDGGVLRKDVITDHP